MKRIFATILTLTVLALASRVDASPELAAKARDVLNKHCADCHGKDPKKIKGRLNLFETSHLEDAARKIVVAKKPSESELYKQIEDGSMPPGSRPKVSDDEKKILHDWIMAGGSFTAAAAPVPVEKAPVAGPVPAGGPDAVRSAEVKEIFRAHCLECHGGSKTQAGVAIMDHGALLTKKRVIPGKADESLIFQLVSATDNSVMPPVGQPRLSPAQVETVRRWISAGAPQFPANVVVPAEVQKAPGFKGGVGVEYVHASILKHVLSVPLKDRRYQRYFSINHILAAGATENDLELHREAFAKAINHLSWQKYLVRPTAIDGPLATVFVLDLRNLGWQYQPYELWRGGKNYGPSKINLFDLALLDYPYGIVYEDSNTFDRLLKEFVVPSEMAAPITFVRADWFASVITQPPFYEDFLTLPHDLKDLEYRLGVDSYANIQGGHAKRAGMAVSGVSRNNRVVERHPMKYGAYWKSYDFRSSKGPENIFRDPIHFQASGGEMIFNLPNGLQGYYVSNAQDVRVEEAPTDIVTDKFAEDKIVRNGLACMRCHDRGMKEFIDNVRPGLVRLPGTPGFDKRFALQLYPEQAEMDNWLKIDRTRFEGAMSKLLGKPLTRDPLIPVSRRYLDDPLYLGTVAGELGLRDPGGLQEVFRSPQFVGLGLMPLSVQGVVRRDAWENYYAPVVRHLGLGIPVVPLDGVALRDFPALGHDPLKVVLKTDKKGNVYEVGDKLVITVTNESHRAIYIELIGTSARGEKTFVTKTPVKVEAGKSFKTDSIKIRAGVGKEQITLFASYHEFPGGELLRLRHELRTSYRGIHVSDRVIHGYYAYHQSGNRWVRRFDSDSMVKKTIDIETK